MAKDVFGTSHYKYADCLMDFAYYLLSVDNVKGSTEIYKIAVDVRLDCFGADNFQVALAYKNLAYENLAKEYDGTNRYSGALKPQT